METTRAYLRHLNHSSTARVTAYFPRHLLLWLCLLLQSVAATAGERPRPTGQGEANAIRVAVASNFTATLQALIEPYRQRHAEVQFKLSSAATGQLYQQIVNGAPYDLFFAADWQRPDKLIKRGIGEKHRAVIYAIGHLSFWSPSIQASDINSALKALQANRHHKLAIANPEHAPYGKGALQMIQRAGYANVLEGQIVTGNSVAQAFHFARTGAATAAIIATSMVRENALQQQAIELPQGWYTPIKQQLLVIEQRPQVMHFYRFVQSAAARAIIAKHGYSLPTAADIKLRL